MDPNDTVHAPTVARNIVREARDQAVVVTGSRLLPAQLAGNTGSGNRMNTIAVSGRLAGDLTLPQAGLAWTVGPWCCTGGLTVDPGATLRLDAGATLKFDQFAGLTVHGTLIGAGTASSPATLTALTDDSVAGDTNGDGTATTPTPGHWAGIQVADPGGSNPAPVVRLDATELRYAGTAVSVGTPADVAIHGAIRHSQVGVASDWWVDATQVDWGDPTGPAPEGQGVAVQGNGVFYMPWVGWTPPPRPPVAPPPPPSESPECADVLFIGVRGSGEGPQGDPPFFTNDFDGFGTRMWTSYQAFEQQLRELEPNATVKAYGLRYRALGLPYNVINMGTDAYFNSIYDGVDKLNAYVDAETARCAGDVPRLVLAGYSQGALVVHIVLRQFAEFEPEMLSPSRLGAVILLADPAKTPNGSETIWQGANELAGAGIRNAEGVWHKLFKAYNETTYHGPLPTAITDRTVSLCHENDWVCSPGWLSGSGPHGNYSFEENTALGEWAAGKVASGIP